jgi:hypothetical protein
MNTMQAQVEEMYFMFYREYMNAALSREICDIPPLSRDGQS